MKIKTLCLAILAVFAVSCTEKISEDNEIQIDSSSKSALVQTSIPADAGRAESITFTATGPWHILIKPYTKADSADWISVSPDHGDAGTYTLTITLKANTAEEPRSAKVEIVCGENVQEVDITQQAAPQPQGPAMVKSVITESAYDGEVERSTFSFEYDDNGRVSKMVLGVFGDTPEPYSITYSDGKAVITITDGNYSKSVPLTLDKNGRVIGSMLDEDYGINFFYDVEGRFMKFGDTYDDFIYMLYKDNAFVNYYDAWYDGGTIDDGKLAELNAKYAGYVDILYPHHYSNAGTNMDINLFVHSMYDSDLLEVTPYMMLSPGVRFGDYLIEHPSLPVYTEEDEDTPWRSGVSEEAPGTTHILDWNGDGVSDEGDCFSETYQSKDIKAGVWTFNNANVPEKFTFSISYDEYSECYVATVTPDVCTDFDLIFEYVLNNHPDVEDVDEYISSHTFYYVEMSTQRTLVKEKAETVDVTMTVEYL